MMILEVEVRNGKVHQASHKERRPVNGRINVRNDNTDSHKYCLAIGQMDSRNGTGTRKTTSVI